jgi:hypothetical protein
MLYFFCRFSLSDDEFLSYAKILKEVRVEFPHKKRIKLQKKKKRRK